MWRGGQENDTSVPPIARRRNVGRRWTTGQPRYGEGSRSPGDVLALGFRMLPQISVGNKTDNGTRRTKQTKRHRHRRLDTNASDDNQNPLRHRRGG